MMIKTYAHVYAMAAPAGAIRGVLSVPDVGDGKAQQRAIDLAVTVLAVAHKGARLAIVRDTGSVFLSRKDRRAAASRARRRPR